MIYGKQQQQQQYFRKKPQDETVKEGSSLILPCEVEHRTGDVQWTKDGLTLGFNRSLPGFPRYSVKGSLQHDEYNLEIRHVSFEDNAIFECQVGPALHNLPIRASAKVEVICAPSSITIIGLNSGSKMTVQEQDEVELTCFVTNAKPKAHLVWFRESSEFYTVFREDEDKLADTESGKISSFSTIKFRPSKDDDSKTYYCEAEHPAVNSGSLRASVMLSVEHASGPPIISGYTQGDIIQISNPVNLICSSMGGNPLANVSWYRNGILIDDSTSFLLGRESRNTYSFIAQSQDNNAVFICKSFNRLSEPLEAEIVLSVQFSPSTVILKGPTEVRLNEVVSYDCFSGPSNPASSLTWSLDNSTLHNAVTSSLYSSSGGWTTQSNVTLVISETFRKRILSCKVTTPEVNDVKTESLLLSVISPPGIPKIQGLGNNEFFTEGLPRRLTCSSYSGHPPPSLKWIQNSSVLPSTPLRRNDSLTGAELDFLPDRRDNGQTLSCEVSQSALETPLVSSLILSVLFPPQFVKMSANTSSLRIGINLTLTCESGTSNPESIITWKNSDEILHGFKSEVLSSDFGGYNTRSQLLLSPTVSHHGAVISCEARNSVNRVSDSLTLSVTFKPVFSDKYSVPLEVLEGQRAIINMSALSNPPVTTYSWFHEETKTLLKTNEYLTISNGLLTIVKVQKFHNGLYSVIASNSEGSSKALFEISVLYSPEILDITPQVIVGIGETAHIECGVTANPLNSTSIRWERDNYDLKKRTVTEEGSSTFSSPSSSSHAHAHQRVSLLTIPNTAPNDSGYFVCVAENGIPSSELSRRKALLLVRHRPVMTSSVYSSSSPPPPPSSSTMKTTLTSPMRRAASEIGSSVLLFCSGTGVPDVSVSWYKAPSRLLESNEKWRVTTEYNDSLHWYSELKVSNVEISDFGNYECLARNTEGISREIIHLNISSAPEEPFNLRITEISSEYIKLSWTPGFDGGLDTRFRIRLSSSSSAPEFRDVIPANVNNYTVLSLKAGTEYTFSILAYNKRGETNYTIESVTGTTTLTTNVEGQMMLKDKGQVPYIVIVSVSVSGTLLLLANALIISCVLLKRKSQKSNKNNIKQGSKGSESASSRTGSTKSGTMELYTSSYNETLSGGETLSSISEKSVVSNRACVEYGNGRPYFEDACTPNSLSTYLVDSASPFMDSELLQRNENRHLEIPLYSLIHKGSHELNYNEYEETESEYAGDVRRKAGECYGRDRIHSHPYSSPYSELQGVSELQAVSRTSGSEVPLCSSSPKRFVSSFQTFGTIPSHLSHLV